MKRAPLFITIPLTLLILGAALVGTRSVIVNSTTGVLVGTDTNFFVNNSNAVNAAIDRTYGIDGTNGLNGTNGLDGINGTNGLDGVNGTNGLNGINGTNGLSGTNGLNGINGTNGLNGLNGTNGLSGTNGLNGINGTNGLNGVNGTNGLNGVNGTSGATNEVTYSATVSTASTMTGLGFANAINGSVGVLIPPTSSNLLFVIESTSGASNNAATVSSGDNYFGFCPALLRTATFYVWPFCSLATNGARFAIGLTASTRTVFMQTCDTPASNSVYFRYTSSPSLLGTNDSTWVAVTSNGTTNTFTDTHIAYSTNRQVFSFAFNNVDTVWFYINNACVATNTTGYPIANMQQIGSVIGLTNNATRTIAIERLVFTQILPPL